MPAYALAPPCTKAVSGAAVSMAPLGSEAISDFTAAMKWTMPGVVGAPEVRVARVPG